MERLSEAQDEAMRIELALNAVKFALTQAEQAGDGPAMVRLYAREAELLHRRAEVADHVSVIAALLWPPNQPPPADSRRPCIVH